MRTRLHNASALLIALWAIVFVSVTVIGVLAMVKSDFEEAAGLNESLLARQIAESGVAIGMHPLIDEGDPLLTGTSDLGGAYEVKIASEAGRLNINQVLRNNQTDILQRLFVLWGLSQDETSALIDSLQDWMSASGAHRLNGTGDQYYENLGMGTLPADRTFTSVKEIGIIHGMNAVMARKPDWEDYFTVWSKGQLDLNDAPADLICAVCQVSPDKAQDLVSYRETMRTAANPAQRRWTQLSDPLQLLGIPPEIQKQITPLVTVTGDLWRIECTASVQKRRCVLGVIARRKSAEVVYRYEK